MLTIVPIVEGDGDVTAFPELLGRILYERCNRHDVIVAQGKGKVVKGNSRTRLEADIGRYIQHAQNKPECDAIIVLLDSDVDCPVTSAQRLFQECAAVVPKCPVEIVYACRSYESWLLASLDTIKRQNIISDTASFSGNAEDVPSPKRWLSNQMPPGRAYKATTHQPALSKHIDIDLAHKNSRSFRRLCHALEQLLGATDAVPAR